MKLVVEGEVPSQKNNKQIAINRSTGRTFVVSNKRVKEWQEKAHTSLRRQFQGYQISGYPIPVTLVFYYGTKRRKDIDNSASSVMDALVTAGILEDDNYNFVDCLVLRYGGLDKENPRVEVYLDEVR